MTTIELYGSYDVKVSGNPNFTYFNPDYKLENRVESRHTNFRCEYIRSDSNKEVSLINANLKNLLSQFTAINGIVITFIELTNINLIESIKLKIDEAEFDFSPKIITMLENINKQKLIYKLGSNLAIKLPLDQFDEIINLFPELPINLEIKLLSPHVVRVDFKAIKLDTEETRRRIQDYEKFSRRIKFYRFDKSNSENLISSDYGIKDIYWNFDKDLESVSLDINGLMLNYDFYQLSCSNYLMENKEPINELFWCPLSLPGTTPLAGGVNTVDFKFKFTQNYVSGFESKLKSEIEYFLVEPKILYYYKLEEKLKCKFISYKS